MQDETLGAWIIHHGRKLDLVESAAGYERLHASGRAGALLCALAGSLESTVPEIKVRSLASTCNIDVVYQLPALLDQLEARALIDRSAAGDVRVLGMTGTLVLRHTATLFNDLAPSKAEKAAISLAESVSERPVRRSHLAEWLADTHKLTTGDTSQILLDAHDIGFTDAEPLTQRDAELVYFNGNLFRGSEAAKISHALAALSEEEGRKVHEANALLQSDGCVALSQIRGVLGKGLADRLVAIGMYDLSEVSNEQETQSYVTKPSSFSKFGGPSHVEDAFDLAKALVASLKYGMTRSSYGRGRIVAIKALLSALLTGRTIGPADAIGEDYRYLELKRVVEVQRTGRQYRMRLLKMDIGQLAYDVIIHGDASTSSLLRVPEAPVSRFSGPETQRSRVRKRQRKHGGAHISKLLDSLRTGDL